MNIHHLELFYYVAKSGGVSAAARRIPYGIQQPSISAQVIALEDDLRTTLFHRRPFQLTKSGEELFRFIEPFFGGIDEMARRLRGGAEANLRIAASETVQREYLPRLLLAMRKRLPSLHFSLVSEVFEKIQQGLVSQEIDVAIAPLVDPRPEGLKELELVRVPLALLVRADSRVNSADELWQRDRIDEPLVTGPAQGLFYRVFQQEIQRRKVEWFSSLELISHELIARYVLEGFGIGLVTAEPGMAIPPGTRLVALSGFPEVPYGLLWTGIPSPALEVFVEEAKKLAKALAA